MSGTSSLVQTFLDFFALLAAVGSAAGSVSGALDAGRAVGAGVAAVAGGACGDPALAAALARQRKGAKIAMAVAAGATSLMDRKIVGRCMRPRSRSSERTFSWWFLV
jgi:hypothetical protein